MNNLRICSHPFIRWQLAKLRNEKTKSRDFQALVHEISRFLLFEACREFQSRKISVKTPTGEKTTGHVPANEILVVPVLRAGIGMGAAAFECIPGVRVCHLGLERNEKTFRARAYYEKRPKNGSVRKDSRWIIVDPMIATGGSANDALDRVKLWGAKHLSLVGIIAAPEGIEAVNERHPDVEITVAAVDLGLNEKKYILPGLGDAGDRQFNT